MARKYDSEETKQKILSSSVRLFIEKGYHETTMTEILHDAGVSGSSFHSIFHTKDGVLAELTEFMFENQFGVAEKIIGTGKNPVPGEIRYQNATFSRSQFFSSAMGTRTCSIVSRSRMVTALSAGVFSSPTVAKSTVMQ